MLLRWLRQQHIFNPSSKRTDMSSERVVIVDDDPALYAQLEHRCAGTSYTPRAQPWSADAAARLAEAQPAAVVIHVPSAGPAPQEASLLAHLQEDPDIRHVPVVVCSERPAVLQSAVQALQARPGVVLASAPVAEEVVSKLQAAQETAR